MLAQRLARLFGAAVVLSLLTSCELEMDVILYNNTDRVISVGSDDGRSLFIRPRASAKVNEFWSTHPTVIGPKSYHYTYPMTPVPSEYTEASTLKLIRRFEFAADHRIYILPRGTPPNRIPPWQPAGFPLSPR